ncbi:SRPBCC family protein [Halorubrum cibi]|uniref:Polyketide cyclase / dehydrase and lipid transport n=1 Tax=Halorubrum cibi TaxID=413815 RepID=A0A521BKC6_9EURY|nr:SRPBCC family protein [Halorubrum cibi]SMO47594.1 Polyketide cyclase / dehydrase and lipid transport [Halorubrum cibi]
MTTFEHTIEIAAPVEHVFAFDSTPENWSRTMASLRDLEVVEETDHGARMTGTYGVFGISMEVEMEMTVVEPNEELLVTIESDEMSGEIRNRYSEIAAGTRLSHRATYEMGDSLLDRILKPVASRYNERQLENHLRNTKDLVEAEVAAESAAPA